MQISVSAHRTSWATDACSTAASRLARSHGLDLRPLDIVVPLGTEDLAQDALEVRKPISRNYKPYDDDRAGCNRNGRDEGDDPGDADARVGAFRGRLGMHGPDGRGGHNASAPASPTKSGRDASQTAQLGGVRDTLPGVDRKHETLAFM